MSDRASRMLDVAVLSLAVRLLPAARREWGLAMRAELTTIPPGPGRWRFVAGCVRVALTQPVTFGSLAYVALVVAVVAGAVTSTSGMEYAPLHLGLLLMTALFVAVSFAGRRPPLLGPVAAHPAARAARGAGYVVAGTAALLSFLDLRQMTGPQPEDAWSGVPILAVCIALYLVAFLAVTGSRSHARSATLVVGALTGLATAATWVLAVVVNPPIPDDFNGALVLVLLAFGAAALIRSSSAGQAAMAGLLASTMSALLIWISVEVMSAVGPDSWIPAIVPVALTPASRLSESRIEISDPYVPVAFFGDLLALLLTLTVAAVRSRRPAPQAPLQVPAPAGSCGP